MSVFIEIFTVFVEYERMFEVFAVGERLPKHQLKVFFNHCDHHPAEKDINFAFNAVFRSKLDLATTHGCAYFKQLYFRANTIAFKEALQTTPVDR